MNRLRAERKRTGITSRQQRKRRVAQVHTRNGTRAEWAARQRELSGKK